MNSEESDTKSFKAAGTISPGDLVMVDSSGYVTRTVNVTDDEYIGSADFDAAQFAAKGTDYYSSGDMCRVLLRGKAITVNHYDTAQTLITPGCFVKIGSPGGVMVEATAATKTLNSIGICIKGGSSTCVIVPL